MISPVAAATKTITAGVAPGGSSNPRVNSEDPAATNAAVMSCSNGHSSSAKPTNAVISQTVSWANRIAAACADRIRSRRL